MTKYRTQSANVLNEADRFQKILDWQLFCSDQETKLWGYNAETTWLPGEPIYRDPRDIYYSLEPSNLEDGEFAFWSGPVGNAPRRMIELLGDGDSYGEVRCKECDVFWEGDSNCWMCGVERPDLLKRKQDWDYLGVIDYRARNEIQYRAIMMERRLIIEVDRLIQDAVIPSVRDFIFIARQEGERLSATLRGLTHSLSIMSEASSWDGLQNPYPLHMPYAPPRPAPTRFEVPSREIELVPPVAADLSKAPISRFRMPDGIDISARREPPMPQMPEPRDFSTWSMLDNYPITAITERRRP